ncbi:MAG: hypothetical protein D6698_03945 [Gammaproteobacteria bacterium]|nr:MAG: hypothetical protein D6698_03945 [Gammaproteobacteria bacterium]
MNPSNINSFFSRCLEQATSYAKYDSFESFLESCPDPVDLTDNARAVIKRRYAAKDPDDNLLEDEKAVFARVAWEIASVEGEFRSYWAAEFYRAMIEGRFMPNSPVLFNAGLNNGFSYSACHVLVPQDTLESIVEVQKQLALVQRAGGGVGYTFEHLRPRGSYIKSTRSRVDGPLPFIDSYCSTTNAIQQGSKRRGAQMGILTVTHPDIWDFIHAKEDLSRWQNMNVSVKMTDDWLKEFMENPNSPCFVFHEKWGEGYLVKEDDKVVAKRVSADAPNLLTKKELMDAIVSRAHSTGEPGVLFWDRVKKDCVFPEGSEFEIQATNPCFAPGTPILTTEGYKPIEKIHKGDIILQDSRVSYVGPELDNNNPLHWVVNPQKEGNLEEVEVEWAGVTRRNAEVWEVHLDNGLSLTLTEDHHLATSRGMVSVADLSEEDEILCNMGSLLEVDLSSSENVKSLKQGLLAGLSELSGGDLRDFVSTDLLASAMSSLDIPADVSQGLAHVGVFADSVTTLPKLEDSDPYFAYGYYYAFEGNPLPNARIAKTLQLKLMEVGIPTSLTASNELIPLPNTVCRARMVYKGRFGISDVYCLKTAGNRTVVAGGIVARRCGEIPLEDGGSCTIGSVNVSKFLGDNGDVDWYGLGETIALAVRFLDNVVSLNRFPVEKIQKVNDETRRIGVGPMGWADLLFKMGLSYDSPEALALSEKMSAFFREAADSASVALGSARGIYPAASKTKNGLDRKRNAYTTMAAPTGTISILAGCSPSIEPVFSLAFRRRVMVDMDGNPTELMEVNPVFRCVMESYPEDKDDICEHAAAYGTIQNYEPKSIPEDHWRHIKKVFVCAHDIPPEVHVRTQAAWQSHFDQAISKTISLPQDSSKNDLLDTIVLAWATGCKGITVYRDGSRDGKEGQIQPMSLKKDNEGASVWEPIKPPKVAPSTRVTQATPLGNIHVTVVFDPKTRRPIEIFGDISRPGEMPKADVDAICRLASLLLRSGAGIDVIYKQLKGLGSSYSLPSAGGRVLSIPDGIAKALELAIPEILGSSGPTDSVTVSSRESLHVTFYSLACQNCGCSLNTSGNCEFCPSCGFSICV